MIFLIQIEWNNKSNIFLKIIQNLEVYLISTTKNNKWKLA